MKKSIQIFAFLIFVSFYFEANGQIFEPKNPCPEKKGNVAVGNSESDPCDVNVPEAYSQCLCNYYKEVKEYNRKLGEYQAKSREIQGKIQNLMGGGNRKDALIGISEAQGFSQRKENILSELKNDLERLHTGLSLSNELNRYCVNSRNCAEGNINYFTEKIAAINKEIGDVIRMQSTENDQIVIQGSTDYWSKDNSNSSNSSTNQQATSTNSNNASGNVLDDRINNYKEQANNINPQYQFQQDYKNQLLAKAKELEQRKIDQNPNTVYRGMDGSGGSTGYNSTIIQKKLESSQKYQSQMATIDAVSTGISILGNYFYQRAAEKQRYEEEQYRLKEQEAERKRLFDKEVYRVRNEYASFVNARKSFFYPIKLKNTFDVDGSNFDPIFFYFVFTPKGYDKLTENVSYPNSIDFKVQEEATVSFSGLFGVFPQVNGQYPYLEDIKKQILNNYPNIKPERYDIKFFNWEPNINDAITSLTKNMEAATQTHNFSAVKFLGTNKIIFLNDKIDASQSIDYFTGETIKKQETKKVNYFNDKETPKSTEKTDYWDTPKQTKQKTEEKPKTTPKKETNYWDN